MKAHKLFSKDSKKSDDTTGLDTLSEEVSWEKALRKISLENGISFHSHHRNRHRQERVWIPHSQWIICPRHKPLTFHNHL
jgi:hypothetical protein